MPSSHSRDANNIYHIKITLRHLRPPIWRRVLVPGNFTLAQLHTIIQIAMGWQDYHLHQFTIGEIFYSIPDPDSWYEVKDERRLRLAQVAATAPFKFRYEYDFGDSWEHDILIEKIEPRQPEGIYPICVKGKRACPPEDCGGVWGYANFITALGDPNHPEHADYIEWWGERDFDPEAFDLAEVNEALQHLKE